MSVTLPTAAFRVRTAPFPPTGWTFAILSSDGTAQREQISDPVFTADYDNELFQSEMTYKVLASHPDYQSSAKLMRGWFDEQEGFHVMSTEEADDDRSDIIPSALLAIVDKATDVQRRTALLALFEAVFADSATKAVICNYIATCDFTPASATGPVWNITSLPGAVAGQPYSVDLYYAVVGTPATGKTITRITIGSLPAWLTSSISPSEGKLSLRTPSGTNAPSGTTSFEVSLVLEQSDGKTTPKTFIVPINLAVYVFVTYNKTARTLTIYVGPNGEGTPSTKMLFTPASFGDLTSHGMTLLDSPVTHNSIQHFYWFTFSNIVTGHYDNKVTWLSSDRYFSLDILEDVDFEEVPQISTAQPSQIADTPWSQVGSAESPNQIDYAWDTLVIDGYTSRQLQFWVKLDDPDQRVELGVTKNGTDLGYGTIEHGDYGSGFQNYQAFYQAEPGYVYTLRFRKLGQTDPFATITLPALPSSGFVSRKTIYP